MKSSFTNNNRIYLYHSFSKETPAREETIALTKKNCLFAFFAKCFGLDVQLKIGGQICLLNKTSLKKWMSRQGEKFSADTFKEKIKALIEKREALFLQPKQTLPPQKKISLPKKIKPVSKMSTVKPLPDMDAPLATAPLPPQTPPLALPTLDMVQLTTSTDPLSSSNDKSPSKYTTAQIESFSKDSAQFSLEFKDTPQAKEHVSDLTPEQVNKLVHQFDGESITYLTQKQVENLDIKKLTEPTSLEVEFNNLLRFISLFETDLERTTPLHYLGKEQLALAIPHLNLPSLERLKESQIQLLNSGALLLLITKGMDKGKLFGRASNLQIEELLADKNVTSSPSHLGPLRNELKRRYPQGNIPRTKFVTKKMTLDLPDLIISEESKTLNDFYTKIKKAHATGTYETIFDLEKGCKKIDIEKKYRKLALQTHGDKFPADPDNAQKIFQIFTAIKEWLTDEIKVGAR